MSTAGFNLFQICPEGGLETFCRDVSIVYVYLGVCKSGCLAVHYIDLAVIMGLG